MSNMKKEKKCTVRICEDYVVRDSEKVKAILDRVSAIISKSYIESNRGTKK